MGEFRNLQVGWDGYKADPPTESVIKRVEDYLTLTSSILLPSRVAPSVIGGIGITYRVKEKDLKEKVYLEFFNTGKLLILFSRENPQPYLKSSEILDQSPLYVIENVKKYLE